MYGVGYPKLGFKMIWVILQAAAISKPITISHSATHQRLDTWFSTGEERDDLNPKP